jgi:hypothetical protein
LLGPYEIIKEIGEESFSGSEYFNPFVLDEKLYWESLFKQKISDLLWEMTAEIAAGDNGFALTGDQYRKISKDYVQKEFSQDGGLDGVLHWILMDKAIYFEPLTLSENGNKDFYRVYLKEDLNLLRKNPNLFDDSIDKYLETLESKFVKGYRIGNVCKKVIGEIGAKRLPENEYHEMVKRAAQDEFLYNPNAYVEEAEQELKEKVKDMVIWNQEKKKQKTKMFKISPA